MDMMEARFRMMAMIGGTREVFGGNNLKYLIPIELTTPSTGKMEFYTGLVSPTEFTIGALFQPTVNDTDGYQRKMYEFVFGMAFSRGQASAGYVNAYNNFYAFSTAPYNGVGTFEVLGPSGPWSNFSNPIYIKQSSIPVENYTSFLPDKYLTGFLLVYDTNHTGNAEQKAITDSGMSVYFSTTNPLE
jgi:hypothetical protein